MSNALAVLSQYENAEIVLPSGHRVRPRVFSGDVVVHKPLAPTFEGLFNFGEIVSYNQQVAEYNRRTLEALSEFSGQNQFKRLPPLVAGRAATAWAFINTGRTNLLNGTHDIDSDTWKMALFLSTSDLAATETTYAGVTNEHSNANGYTTGGASITLTLAGTTTVTVDISSDPVWTASGGSITARFAAIYEVSGNVLVFCTLDSTPADVTATTGNTLTVAANASGVFTLA